MENEEQVTIPVKVYKDLMDNILFLTCLQEAGVNNWEGYSYAQELYQEQSGE